MVYLKFLSDDNRSSKEPDMKMKSTAELTLHKRTLDAVETFYTWITYRIRITLLFSESPNSFKLHLQLILSLGPVPSRPLPIS